MLIGHCKLCGCELHGTEAHVQQERDYLAAHPELAGFEIGRVCEDCTAVEDPDEERVQGSTWVREAN